MPGLLLCVTASDVAFVGVKTFSTALDRCLVNKEKEGNDGIISSLKEPELARLLSVEKRLVSRADWLASWTLLEDDTNSRVKLTAGVGKTDIDHALVL